MSENNQSDREKLDAVRRALEEMIMFVDGDAEGDALREYHKDELDRDSPREALCWELGYDVALLELSERVGRAGMHYQAKLDADKWRREAGQ
jgi:hypothetical protein